MLKYDHFIFDFDGTLSDSYPAFVKAAKEVAEVYGVCADEKQIYHLLKKYSTVHLFDTLGFGENREQAYRKFQTLSNEYLRNEAVAMEGAEELLRWIEERGGKSYIYSHSGDVVLANVKKWGLEPYFADYMLGGKQYPRKPAPDTLLALVERATLDLARCVMIGDRDIDVLAGKNAGMDGILIDDEGFYGDLEVTYRVTCLGEIKNCILN